MWIVGLGNPGTRYRGTRHNVGLDLLLRLVERWRGKPADRGRAFEGFRAEVGGHSVVLLAPLTYMNRSGEGLAAYQTTSGLVMEPEATLVLSDDVYLPVGALRVRASGSTGGHLGLLSVERFFGGSSYPRLRIGVGAVRSEELPDHVLSGFEPEEREALEEALDRAEQAVEVWVQEGVGAAQNRFNRRLKEDRS